MAAIAFTDAQLEQIRIRMTARHRSHADCWTQRVVELLNGRDFCEGDVHRAARAAAGEILHGPRPAQAGRAVASK